MAIDLVTKYGSEVDGGIYTAEEHNSLVKEIEDAINGKPDSEAVADEVQQAMGSAIGKWTLMYEHEVTEDEVGVFSWEFNTKAYPELAKAKHVFISYINTDGTQSDTPWVVCNVNGSVKIGNYCFPTKFASWWLTRLNGMWVVGSKTSTNTTTGVGNSRIYPSITGDKNGAPVQSFASGSISKLVWKSYKAWLKQGDIIKIYIA